MSEPEVAGQQPEILTCPRCGYCTPHRYNMKKHLLKTNPCKPLLLDMPREEIQSQFPFLVAKPLKGGPKQFSCTDCQNQFNTKQALVLHKKNNCKGYCQGLTAEQRFQKLEQENKVLRKQVEDLQTKSQAPPQMVVETNSHNTNCNNTVNNTVVINAFRKEDVTHLIEDQQFMATVVRRREKGMLELIKATYFDPNHPENRNVRVTNYKYPLIDTYDGKRWNKCEKAEILEDMLDNSCSHIDEHYEDNKYVLLEEFSDSLKNLVREFMARIKDRDQHKAFFNELKQRIHLLIINESKPGV